MQSADGQYFMVNGQTEQTSQTYYPTSGGCSSCPSGNKPRTVYAPPSPIHTPLTPIIQNNFCEERKICPPKGSVLIATGNCDTQGAFPTRNGQVLRALKKDINGPDRSDNYYVDFESLEARDITGWNLLPNGTIPASAISGLGNSGLGNLTLALNGSQLSYSIGGQTSNTVSLSTGSGSSSYDCNTNPCRFVKTVNGTAPDNNGNVSVSTGTGNFDPSKLKIDFYPMKFNTNGIAVKKEVNTPQDYCVGMGGDISYNGQIISSEYVNWDEILDMNTVKPRTSDGRLIGTSTAGSSSLGGIWMRDTAGQYTFTVPAGVTRVKVTCIGGGGGGDIICKTQTFTTSTDSIGANSGEMSILYRNVNPGDTLSVNVGLGGLCTTPSGFNQSSYAGFQGQPTMVAASGAANLSNNFVIAGGGKGANGVASTGNAGFGDIVIAGKQGSAYSNGGGFSSPSTTFLATSLGGISPMFGFQMGSISEFNAFSLNTLKKSYGAGGPSLWIPSTAMYAVWDSPNKAIPLGGDGACIIEY